LTSSGRPCPRTTTSSTKPVAGALPGTKNLQAKATIQAIFPFMAVAIFATQLGMGKTEPGILIAANLIGMSLLQIYTAVPPTVSAAGSW